jgi:hypothetical protein
MLVDVSTLTNGLSYPSIVAEGKILIYWKLVVMSQRGILDAAISAVAFSSMRQNDSIDR